MATCRYSSARGPSGRGAAGCHPGDSRKLLRMRFSEDNHFLGGEIVEDSVEIVRHNYWRDAAWHHALGGMDLPPKNTPSASSVHEARDALGRRLRELRQLAGMTGAQLAVSLSWPQSKISKPETTRQTPSDDDIRAWTRATGSEPHTDELLTALHTLEAQHAEWQRVLRPGLQPHQSKLSELDAKARLFRVFEATVVPGLLQTAEYARVRLAQGVILFNASNDINAAVQARMKRQELLYRPDKIFHFVMPETALRLRLCGSKVSALRASGGSG